jgi:hypothetical protein
MKNKVTLITPPDFFENGNFSLMLIGINDIDQEKVTKWLSSIDLDEHINIYFYMGEPNIPWLLYAVSRSDLVFIDLDFDNNIIKNLSSYMASKSHVYLQTHNSELGQMFEHISGNRVPDIDYFLEHVFDK